MRVEGSDDMAHADTRTITTHVPLALAKKVDELAGYKDESRAEIMRQALIELVEREEEYHRRTLRGLKDVDEGRLTDDEKVAAWIECLGTEKEFRLMDR